jgi:hypothetical protein
VVVLTAVAALLDAAARISQTLGTLRTRRTCGPTLRPRNR